MRQDGTGRPFSEGSGRQWPSRINLQRPCPECTGCSTTPNNIRSHVSPTHQRLFIPAQSEAPSSQLRTRVTHQMSSRKAGILKAVSSKTGAYHGFKPSVVPKGQAWRSSLPQKKKRSKGNSGREQPQCTWRCCSRTHTHTHQPRSLTDPHRHTDTLFFTSPGKGQGHRANLSASVCYVTNTGLCLFSW